MIIPWRVATKHEALNEFLHVLLHAVLGAEDLRPSLWSWLKLLPHRASKELHVHPAGIRLDAGRFGFSSI